MEMIFAMAAPWPADWQFVCSACSGFADFCAGFVQMRAQAGMMVDTDRHDSRQFRVGRDGIERIRASQTATADHEIMTTDDY
jgi:hypothetical protein